jgi:hypothetical protein
MAAINGIDTTQHPIQIQEPNNCFHDRKKVIQTAKTAFFWIASMATLLIPIHPSVRGALAGGTFFFGLNALIQHPDSVYMTNGLAKKRNWRQLTAGTAVCGLGWSLGTLALTSKASPLLLLTGAFGMLAGTIFSIAVAYGRSSAPVLQPGTEEV